MSPAPGVDEAIVLAGGLGTRLRAVVSDVPKVLAPVGGRPFLEYVLSSLQREGVSRVVLAVGYKRELVQAHFGDRFENLRLEYSVESAPLGTGGALRQALGLTAAPQVVALNGDTFVEIDIAGMCAEQRRCGTVLTMAAVRVDNVGRYGALDLADGRVVGWREKGGRGPGWINGGAYLLARSLHGTLDLPSPFSFERDFVTPRLSELRPAAYLCRGSFIDMGVPEDFALAQRMFATRS